MAIEKIKKQLSKIIDDMVLCKKRMKALPLRSSGEIDENIQILNANIESSIFVYSKIKINPKENELNAYLDLLMDYLGHLKQFVKEKEDAASHT